MEELEKNKQFNILKWIFIIISFIHIGYATIVLRGIYEDGSFYIIELLNHLANGSMELQIDWEHPRFFMLAFMELPVVFAYKILLISNKFILMHIYTFVQFFLPLLILYWNYKLTKRTGRTDILFWNLFIYGGINLTFSIFSVVESIIGSMFHFILWNYLASKINYTKKDIFYITCLLIIMFGTFEYVVFLGIIFFIASFHYVTKETNLKNQLVKTYIGIGSLLSSIFNIVYMLRVEDEGSEISRFLQEAYNFSIVLFNLNISFTITALAIIIMLMFRKTLLTNNLLILISAVFLCMFIRLSNTPELSIYPMWEQHLRTIPCWLIPLLFVCMWISDIICPREFNDKEPEQDFGAAAIEGEHPNGSDKSEFKGGKGLDKEEKNKIKFTNYICVILICGITQTCWQLYHDYYWNKNVEYLKNELKNTKQLLYVPAEHEEISSFGNNELRRYIWHSIYPLMSILLSETKEVKTLLLNYDTINDKSNKTFREWLFIPKEGENTMFIPVAGTINITNEFWDLTKCAEALDKYNKKHKIKTMEDMLE